MAQPPFHLQYSLARRQRLGPLLHIEGGVFTTLFAVVLFLFFCVRAVVGAYALSGWDVVGFGVLALFVLVLRRSLFFGLFDVLLVPVRSMDVLVVENAAGILFGSERWYLFFDGITDLRKFRADTWTIQHWNGCVLHIAASAMTDDQIAYIQDAMERGRTPEGIRRVIERGRRIQEILESERND